MKARRPQRRPAAFDFVGNASNDRLRRIVLAGARDSIAATICCIGTPPVAISSLPSLLGIVDRFAMSVRREQVHDFRRLCGVGGRRIEDGRLWPC